MSDHHARPRLGRRRKVGGDGEPEVFCADELGDGSIDIGRWSRLATAVLLAEGVRGLAELSVLYIGEEAIAELNQLYMGKAGPTDVLAFPIDAGEVEVIAGPGGMSRGPDRAPVDLGDLPLLLGDVVICPPVAAGRPRRTPARSTTSSRCSSFMACSTSSATTTPSRTSRR